MNEARLDEGVCAEVGARLAHARNAQQLTVHAIADRLLLSTRQVRALETGDTAAFYNTTFFLSALRKYGTLLSVETEVDGRPPVAVIARPQVAEPPAPGARSDAPGLGSDEAPSGSSPRLLAMGALVVALFAAGSAAIWRARLAAPVSSEMADEPQSAPGLLPSTPLRIEVAATAGDIGTRGGADMAPERGTTGGFGGVHVRRATWVFVRYSSGQVVERMLADGETQSIDSTPVYLAVGSRDVELTVGDRRVDVSRFVVDGEVRMRSADLAALASPDPTFH